MLKSGKILIWGEMKMNRKRKKYHSRVTGLINAVGKSRKGGRVLALRTQLLPVPASPVAPPAAGGDPPPPFPSGPARGGPALLRTARVGPDKGAAHARFGLGFALLGRGR